MMRMKKEKMNKKVKEVKLVHRDQAINRAKKNGLKMIKKKLKVIFLNLKMRVIHPTLAQKGIILKMKRKTQDLNLSHLKSPQKTPL